MGGGNHSYRCMSKASARPLSTASARAPTMIKGPAASHSPNLDHGAPAIFGAPISSQAPGVSAPHEGGSALARCPLRRTGRSGPGAQRGPASADGGGPGRSAGTASGGLPLLRAALSVGARCGTSPHSGASSSLFPSDAQTASWNAAASVASGSRCRGRKSPQRSPERSDQQGVSHSPRPGSGSSHAKPFLERGFRGSGADFFRSP